MKFYCNLICMLFLFATPGFCAEEKVLIDKEITVLRSDFKEVHFLAPSDSSAMQFQGSFKTKGGFYDDLNFLVFTQAEYAKWFTNNPNQPVFKVDKKKESEFKVDAKPGETYYFVMDNFFSTVSNKKVQIVVKLVPKS